MAAGSTYTPIATTTISGTSTNTVTFNSFSGYTDLRLIMNAGTNSVENLNIQFNGDTGSNYSYTYLTGDGSSATSGRGSSSTVILANYYGYLSTSISTVTIVDFMNYSNSTTYKTILSRANNAGNGVSANVGMWRNTNAITSITLKLGTSYILAGSTFTLYGIAAA